MHFIVLSVNYRTAPVEIREKLAFSDENLSETMLELNQEKSILENVIVSTCNRTELYVVADQLHTGRYYVKRFLANQFSLELDYVKKYIEIKEETEAVRHLMKVTAGLDSMVLGETQILGQVRKAFQVAQEVESSGLIFNQLFKQAVTVAKRAHRETAIGENAVSISYAAVELGKQIFNDLKEQHVAILGAGKMGELAVKNLHGSGIRQITVINRTYEKAKEVADKFEGVAKSMDELDEVMQEADILITSASTDSFIITKEQLTPLVSRRNGKPLFLIDISVPRNIDPSVSDLDGVIVYDIDDLQGVINKNLEERQKAANAIERMIDQELDEFDEWIQTLGVVPVISALRNKALSIQETTMASIERKMPDMTDRERKVLNKHTKSIINQMLKEPILQAKEMAGDEEAEEMLKLFVKIFGIEEEVQEELEFQNNKHHSHKTVSQSLPIAGLIKAIQ
ncbi:MULTISPECIES: glutamyl-tRNA reductase [Allobacillus]|uniref:Glutamyl-tRNA reductase n=1 Tax=Allobacillus salarius TaxID=1955272 RepID=A0A556PTY9_9BACI|nr:glutamyl-tRNA reductase [Allobacillus salarius]TSJ67848.1 glutamyl-tRNA reductase [Allobacillus salarius]